MANNEFRSMMRYLAAEKVFEYKADESATQSMRVPESKIGDLRAGIGATDPDMARLLDFLVENAKREPGKWVEATNTQVGKDQALV